MKKSNNRAQRQSKLAAKARTKKRQEIHEQDCRNRQLASEQRYNNYIKSRQSPYLTDRAIPRDPLMDSNVMDLLIGSTGMMPDYGGVEREILADMARMTPMLVIDDIANLNNVRPRGQALSEDKMAGQTINYEDLVKLIK